MGNFFFTSRRRHTRCGRDWSSDVCSSDLHEWIDVLYDRVGAIRDALDGHDRLRREAEAIAQAHERLRSEVDRARRELEDIDAAFARALMLANDLLSPLPREASPSHTT